MSKDDLELCYLKHTTSKISNQEDLFKLTTKGFRGEAISSICSEVKTTPSNLGNYGAYINNHNLWIRNTKTCNDDPKTNSS